MKSRKTKNNSINNETQPDYMDASTNVLLENGGCFNLCGEEGDDAGNCDDEFLLALDASTLDNLTGYNVVSAALI